MLEPYEGSKTEEKVVLLGYGGASFPKVYAVQPGHFPTTGWQLAAALNAAYARGYRQAQADLQSALGMKRS